MMGVRWAQWTPKIQSIAHRSSVNLSYGKSECGALQTITLNLWLSILQKIPPQYQKLAIMMMAPMTAQLEFLQVSEKVKVKQKVGL